MFLDKFIIYLKIIIEKNSYFLNSKYWNIHSEFFDPRTLTSSKYVYYLTISVLSLFWQQKAKFTFKFFKLSGNTSTLQQKSLSIDDSKGVFSRGFFKIKLS